MKKVYWTLIFALLAGVAAQAQISFKKFYGAPSNSDFGADVYRTPSGDFFVTGTVANGDSGFDFFLLETDSTGSAIGFETYGGPKNDVAQGYVPLSDGGHLLFGYTESFGNGGRDGYALRLDPSGAVLWSRTTGSIYDDQIVDGLQLPDGSIVVAANIFTPSGGSDIRVERWSADGNDVLGLFFMDSGTENFSRRLLLTPDHILLTGVLEGQGFIAKLKSDDLLQIWLKTDYTTASVDPKPLLRVEDVISRPGDNLFTAVGRASSPNVNTVFTLDSDGNTVSKFNTLLSGAVAIRLAHGSDHDVFIAGGDHIEHRDSVGMFLNENNGFDAPFDVPQSIRAMIALPSGGIAVVGNTSVYQEGDDAMLSLFDANVEPQSSQLYWNLGPDANEIGYSARQTPDGGYILYGAKFLPENLTDVLLIKTDELGNVVWEMTTGSSGIDRPSSLDLSDNGTFIISGFSYDVQLGEPAVLFVRKFDLEGQEIWSKYFPLGTPDFGLFTVIRSLSDGGSIVALCAPLVTSARRPTLLRLDAQGNVLWSTVHDNFNAHNFLRNLIETPEGNLLGVGMSALPEQFQAALFDEAGSQLWSETYGSVSGIGFGLAATPAGNYIISGYTDANPGQSDSLYIAAIDPQGALIWENYYEGNGILWPRAHVNQAGDIFLAASKPTNSGGPGTRGVLEIRKLTPGGVPVWIQEVEGLEANLFYDSQLTADGGLMAFGFANNNNSQDFCLIKTTPDGVVGINLVEPIATAPEVFPSPAQHDVQIWWQGDYTGRVELRVFDVLGNLQKNVHSHKNAPVLKERIEVAHLPPGTYFVQLVTNEGIVSKPFIKG